MSSKRRVHNAGELDFEAACAAVEEILAGSVRSEVIADIRAHRGSQPLARLRHFLRSHGFRAGERHYDLERIVRRFDGRTRQDGFHVLHDWDGEADRFNKEIIPVDVLNFLMRVHDPGESMPVVLAILLDYYLLHVLSLISLRAWDRGSPDVDLERVGALLRALQGPDGSGQQFAAGPEILVLLATSHFEGEDAAYARLVEKVRALDPSHRLGFARVYAAVLASHLRFGFEAAYGRDLGRMRADNEADYPWLCFSLATLIERYGELRADGSSSGERSQVVEGILNGLTPDPTAFFDDPPAALGPLEAERAGFRDRFLSHRADLRAEFDQLRPGHESYSPIALFFNFPHNVLKGTVVDALLRGRPWGLPLDALLTGFPRAADLDRDRQSLARTLMGYARRSPDPYRGRLVPSIVYDPDSGRRVHRNVLDRIPG